ncbi:MAG: hypothetical protein BWY01_01778 [Synergistetes bacterium ADurb.Bin155]|nr:MAG: hypothetical protein BWY01_01778 [Synergistetes bacterium ADurb.Bin155]
MDLGIPQLEDTSPLTATSVQGARQTPPTSSRGSPPGLYVLGSPPTTTQTSPVVRSLSLHRFSPNFSTVTVLPCTLNTFTHFYSASVSADSHESGEAISGRFRGGGWRLSDLTTWSFFDREKGQSSGTVHLPGDLSKSTVRTPCHGTPPRGEAATVKGRSGSTHRPELTLLPRPQFFAVPQEVRGGANRASVYCQRLFCLASSVAEAGLSAFSQLRNSN